MKTINLREYNISYATLRDWCEETNAELYAIVHHGGNGATTEYGFEKDEDLLAFILRFPLGTDNLDLGYFYCPYIPLLKYEKNNN